VMVEALVVAQEVIREQAEAIEAFAAEHGKEKQRFEATEENPFVAELREKYLARVKEGIVNPDRRARHTALDELQAELTQGRDEEEAGQIAAAISTLEKEAFRQLYLQDRKRTDLRGLDEIRPTPLKFRYCPGCTARGSSPGARRRS
jgi:polyribonucleotide nucleotidyltransferase